MKILISIIIFFGLYGGTLFIKDQANARKKADNPPTLSNIYKEEGTPVEYLEIKSENFIQEIKVSGFLTSDKVITTHLTTEQNSQVKLGQEVYFDQEEKRIFGKILSKSSKADLLTGLIKVQVELKTNENFNTDSIFVVKIPVTTINNIIMAPRASVSFREDKPYVYIINDDLTITKSYVELQEANDNYFRVIHGLSFNDRIITSDSRYLKNGQKVYLTN